MSLADALVAALKGIFSAVFVALGGVYLQRKKAFTPTATKHLAKAYAAVFLPCLMFTRVAGTVNSAQDLKHGVYMTAANFCVVGVGILNGYALRWLCRPAKSFENAFIVCVWMQNAVALPVVLSGAVIAFDEHFADDRDAALARAVGFIAFYGVSNQFFQWLVAYPMLAPPARAEYGEMEEEKQEGEERSMTAVKQKKIPCSRRFCSFVRRRVLVPPVVAVISGTVTGMTPILHDLLVPDSSPFHFIFQGWVGLGLCAPPLSMVILGASMFEQRSSFFDPSSMGGWHIVGAVICGKLILTPLVIFCMLCFVKSAGHLPPDNSLVLAIMMEGLTPSANNVVLMAKMHGYGTSGISTVLFWEYIVGLLPMVMWIALCLSQVAEMDHLRP